MEADGSVKSPVLLVFSAASFIVALFCAAAIFNRLVLHSHPCRLTVLKPMKGWRCQHESECFTDISTKKLCIKKCVAQMKMQRNPPACQGCYWSTRLQV